MEANMDMMDKLMMTAGCIGAGVLLLVVCILVAVFGG
jgi:hypothetical protein